MHVQFVESLLTVYAEVNLSAWDNLRLVLSECTHHECEARGFEVEFLSDLGALQHYWVQVGNIWLDCGRTNAYSATLTQLTDEQVSRANTKKALECAILSQEQIGLLCMQNAHFDHC
ncbi:hypothetical protein L5M18_09450 [Shewanella sp. SM20]|uniref:hypothetical protein n=1 Tax=Shewanella TaxID=22 RepID=UPI0021D7F5BA|nr:MULTISPECIES: hypothetical protein [unclassified Shewanella]MCU7964389.1 hypothetical protein [Shewanella sp. SW32]MCU7972293.1 hypothetical protein [Shewanella sp. SW29]MCU8091785.1 hypothetical protein [Shewanella sp. SM20]